MLNNRDLKFVSDERGAFGVVLAISLVPLMAITGLALDMAKSEMAHTSLQASVDAAAVTAASSFKDTDRVALVTEVFNQMVDNSGIQVTGFNVAFDDEIGSATITASGQVSTIINGMFGNETIDLDASAISSFGLGRAQMDLVMCIDATGSMRWTLATATANAMTLEQNLLAELKTREVPIEGLRARVIFYRDYDPVDLPDPLITSDFYDLPEQRSEMHDFIGSETARGGHNWPEAGLECFNEAMNSAWARPDNAYTILLPVIAIWTDAPSDHPSNNANRIHGGDLYPDDMPSSDADLEAKWDNPDVVPQELKTVVLFGPETGGWTRLREYSGYVHGGSVWTGNSNFVGSLADAIAENVTDLPARLVY